MESQNLAHFRGRFINEFVCVSSNLSDVYPALDDPSSDMWSDLSVLQHCADHAGCHSVKLRNSGTNGWGAVLVVFLIPLGPDGAQAVVGYNLFKQQLEREEQADVSMTTQTKHRRDVTCVTFPFLHHSHCQPAPVSISFPSTYRIHVGQLLSHQVGLKRHEILLDLDLHFLLLPKAKRTVPMETS